MQTTDETAEAPQDSPMRVRTSTSIHVGSTWRVQVIERPFHPVQLAVHGEDSLFVFGASREKIAGWLRGLLAAVEDVTPGEVGDVLERERALGG